MQAITPYLNFDGTCREAMTFYQQCLSGDLNVMTYADSGHSPDPAAADRVMHARLTKGATVIMASDSPIGMPVNKGSDVWLSLACDSAEEVDSLFPVLNKGGQSIMAPHDAFWNARFAMLTDRYGVNWMLNHERAPVPA